MNLPDGSRLWVTLDFKPVGTITLGGGSGTMPTYNMGRFGVSRDADRVYSALPDVAGSQQILIGGRAVLIMNDRPDLCLACGFHGVHVGQEDLSVEGARRVVGSQAVVGVSTHNLPQVLEAERTSADYIAIGPVFATATKANPEPVVGLEMVSAARNVTRKPLVAIGGITRANCRSVIAAGADSIAVISELRSSPCQSVEEFLQKLSAAN